MSHDGVLGGSDVVGHDDRLGDERLLESAIDLRARDEDHTGTRGAILALGRVELEGGSAEQGVLVEQVLDALARDFSPVGKSRVLGPCAEEALCRSRHVFWRKAVFGQEGQQGALSLLAHPFATQLDSRLATDAGGGRHRN